MIDNKNDNLGTDEHNPGSWIYANNSDVEALKNGQTTERGSMLVVTSEKALQQGLFHSWKIPNILYSPENIFANKIAALDANYINPHKYTPVKNSEEAEREAVSFAESIRPTIASWYRAFRNVAIVGLLSVLVYIGIRILMGTVTEKAKYKERLTDWFVALCLVFFMHFIMAGIMLVAEKITELFSNAIDSGIIVAIDDGTIFRTSFMGYIRFAAQSNSWTEAVANGIMYLVLIGITFRFTFVYLKRALYLAFFTMISPLVAITYPIDRAGDGKAQAFNIWIKEYFINAILQPIHLVLYSALVGSAITLVVKNPIYGIVVLLFISTAEKWIKKMFKMDQAVLTSTSLGDVAVLGSMLSMGKSIVGGIGKTAALVGLTVATGGAAAPAAGAAAAGSATAGGVAAESGAMETAGVAGEIANTAAKTTALDVGRGNGISDIVEQRERAELEEKLSDGKLTKEELNERQKQLLDRNTQEIRNRMKDDTNINGSSITPDMIGGKDIEDVATRSTEIGKVNNPNEEKYFKDHVKEKLITKIVSKDPKEELADMLVQGAIGTAGAVVGAPLGAFAAGLTGDNKAIPAGVLGTANVAAGMAKSIMNVGDTVFNNNVKVLVKDGNLGAEHKDIIANVAQIAKKEHWSEGKMLAVGKMAAAYPNLKSNKEAQDRIKEELVKQGVSQNKLERAIQDIIKAQGTSGYKIEVQNTKGQDKMKNWK